MASQGVPAPSYRLFGTINHSGGGPHSGHYTAFVKDSKGAWNNMNDSFVQRCNPPLGQKNAYVLFYCRERGDLLKSAINGGTTTGGQGVNGHGKRPRESLDGAAKGSPASAQGRAANGVNGSAAGPSPAKKPHLANGHAHAQAQQSGPRPPTVITASTTAPNGAAPPPSSSAPPLVGGRGSGVFQSASAGAGAGGVGLSKGQKKKQAKKLKLSTVGKLKPRMLRE